MSLYSNNSVGSYTNNPKRPSVCVPWKCVPYMGTLAAAGCTWSVRGDPGYSGKWAGLARRDRCTPRSWTQQVVHIDWGFLTLQLACIDNYLSVTSNKLST